MKHGLASFLSIMLVVALASAGYYGIRIPGKLYGFSVGDCISGSSAYTYKVQQLGKYSIRAVKAVPYSYGNEYEFEVLDKKDLSRSYLVDCFQTFDAFNKQGETK